LPAGIDGGVGGGPTSVGSPEKAWRARPLTGQYCTRRPDVSAQAAQHQRDALVAQEIAGELGIAGPHVRQPPHHAAAAEQLGLQPAASRAGLEKLVDQQLHREGAIAARAGRRPACGLGQQEVVHAADARLGVTNGLIRSLGAGRCHAARTRRALSKSSFARP